MIPAAAADAATPPSNWVRPLSRISITARAGALLTEYPSIDRSVLGRDGSSAEDCRQSGARAETERCQQGTPTDSA
jgi:hypothetical protein